MFIYFSDVSLPAVFMPPTKSGKAAIYNPRASKYFHPTGSGSSRLTQPPSMIQLPPIPSNVGLDKWNKLWSLFEALVGAKYPQTLLTFRCYHFRDYLWSISLMLPRTSVARVETSGFSIDTCLVSSSDNPRWPPQLHLLLLAIQLPQLLSSRSRRRRRMWRQRCCEIRPQSPSWPPHLRKRLPSNDDVT